MGKKTRFLDGLPAEIKGPITEIYSNKEAVIDGCKGVLDYYETLVKLRVAGGTLTFSGADLSLLELGESSARITGQIANVEFALK